MKTDLYSLAGTKVKSVDLPSQFETDYEPVLIKRASLVILKHQKPYGAMYQAGLIGVSGKISRRRRNYKGSYGHGISRVPRKTLWRRGTQFGWMAAEAPGTVKGRRAHPPKSETLYDLKINKKERRKAIRSALGGTYLTHNLLLVESTLEHIKKTKDLFAALAKLPLAKEMERLQPTNASGKSATRGRTHNTPRGPLFIVADKCALQHAAQNIPGIEISTVKNLNVELLTKGMKPRMSIWTESAMKKLATEKLFQ
ncbi:MAG: uL4 family ribosomal protein [Candidatus Nanoarchaeia archaeon]